MTEKEDWEKMQSGKWHCVCCDTYLEPIDFRAMGTILLQLRKVGKMEQKQSYIKKEIENVKEARCHKSYLISTKDTNTK